MRNLAFAILGVLAACGSGGDDDDEDANNCPAQIGTRCVEQSVRDCYDTAATIGQGVYGCVAEQPDVGDPLPPPYAVRDWRLDVYADSAMTTPIDGTRTSSNGFYEIPAAAGTVYFCDDNRNECHPFTVPTGTLAVDVTISVITTWQGR